MWLTAIPMPIPEPSLPPLRVLYADDNELLRSMVAETLKRKGYIVETASDGAEGWEKVRRAMATATPAFDVVITDINMPNLDGVGFIRLLRESRQPLKIIVFSAAMNVVLDEQLRTLAVDAAVTKGLVAVDLGAVVEQVARRQP